MKGQSSVLLREVADDLEGYTSDHASVLAADKLSIARSRIRRLRAWAKRIDASDAAARNQWAGRKDKNR